MRRLFGNRRLLAGAGLVLAAVLLVALNTFATVALRSYRLDLTEDRVFTLSEGTRRLLQQIDEPITLRLYVSGQIRERDAFLASYADRVHDLLRTYAEMSGGRITVEYIDPEPFSKEEDRAVGFGLQPVALDENTTGYFGIAGTNTTDDVEVIPVLAPERERFLEYDLTRLVYSLAYPDKPVVAILSGLPLNADPAQQFRPWAIYELLKQQFDLRWLAGEIKHIDEDVDVLLLVHPQKLTDATLYAIDQFVLRGGKALVLVDPHSEAQAVRARQLAVTDTKSDLGKLFAAWGIAYDPEKIVADPSAARRVQLPGGGRQRVVDYLAWLALDERHLDRDHAIVAALSRLHLATAGFLKKREDAEVTFTPLLRSSAQAAAMDAADLRLFPDPLGLLQRFEPGEERLTLAAVVTGSFKSAFPDGPPEGADKRDDHLERALQPTSVVVIADTDLMDDRMWLARQPLLGQEVAIPVADNADFVANALDYLHGSEILTALRGRDVGLRPFTLIADMRRQAEARYRAEEQRLLDRLAQLQNKLRSLEIPESGKKKEAVLSPEQQEAIEKFRAEILETRRRLREVQHALRRDIERLEATIRFANIGGVPLLVTLAAIVLAAARRARFRRRVETSGS